MQIEIARELESFTRTIIINIDEVPINFDLSSNKTYNKKGANMVEVKKTSGTKQMFTALFGILSNGFKLPPYLIFKSKSSLQVPEDLKPYLIVRNNSRGWMNETLFMDWMERILFNLIPPKNTHFIFILDQSRIHMTEKIQSSLKSKNHISYFYVPAGCTFLLQPLDVSCNKPIKDRLRARFHSWFEEQGSLTSNQTPSGYFRPPKPSLLMNWVVDELESLPQTIVIDSFKVCGLSNKLDHSEDHLLNKNINNHFVLDNHLQNFLSKDQDPNTDGDRLFCEIRQHESFFTFEHKEQSDSESESELTDSDSELDNLFTDEEITHKVQVTDKQVRKIFSEKEDGSDSEEDPDSQKPSRQVYKTILTLAANDFEKDINYEECNRKKVLPSNKNIQNSKQTALLSFFKKKDV